VSLRQDLLNRFQVWYEDSWLGQGLQYHLHMAVSYWAFFCTGGSPAAASQVLMSVRLHWEWRAQISAHQGASCTHPADRTCMQAIAGRILCRRGRMSYAQPGSSCSGWRVRRQGSSSSQGAARPPPRPAVRAPATTPQLHPPPATTQHQAQRQAPALQQCPSGSSCRPRQTQRCALPWACAAAQPSPSDLCSPPTHPGV
jgi:hypothetical protein